MDIQVRKNSQIAYKPFPSNYPKRRGQGTYSKNSLSQMNGVLQETIFPYFQSHNVNLQDLNQILAVSKDFLNERLESELLKNTVRKEKSFLQSWIVYTFQVNPKRIELELSEIKIPEVGTKKTEKSRSYLNLQDSISEMKNERQRLFIRFAYYSACRVSELVDLKVKEGKLSEDKEEMIFETKGKGNKGIILRCSIEMYEEILKAFNSNSKENTKGILFWNPKSKSNKFSRQYIHLVTSEKLNVNPHKLRHSRATHLVEEGTPINEVSDLLNHSSVNTTTKYYLHNKINSKTLRKKTL